MLASSIINITSTGLHLEEFNKAKTIANSSESEYIAFDRNRGVGCWGLNRPNLDTSFLFWSQEQEKTKHSY